MHSICKYPKCPFTAVLQFESNFGPALVSLKADGGNRVGWSNQREMQKLLTTQKNARIAQAALHKLPEKSRIRFDNLYSNFVDINVISDHSF